MENPIISRWWVDEPDYVALTRDVPIEVFVYETITEYIDLPYATVQNINILQIEFIIFSGDQVKYNESADGAAATHTTVQERNSNERNIFSMAQELLDSGEYYIILHGHANPVTGTDVERIELEAISKARAKDVEKRLFDIYDVLDAGSIYVAPVYSGNPPAVSNGSVLFPVITHQNNPNVNPIPPDHGLSKRVFVKGYGGGRNLGSGSGSYAGLNRRVEMILFEISEEVVTRRWGS